MQTETKKCINDICAAIVISLLTIFTIQACGHAKHWNITNYPDSIILKAFDEAGLNAEAFSRRALRALRVEISTGKFTREEVRAFLQEKRAMVYDGVEYATIARLIEHYTMYLFAPEGDDVSDIAMLAYIMFTPETGNLNIPTVVGPEDRKALLAFIDYLLEGI